MVPRPFSLGMTRVNVYAGPAGFWLLRGGPGDDGGDHQGQRPARLPGRHPALGDAPGMDYYEIPIVIQDRSFNDDGSLFYPDNRAFFEGLEPDQLQIPFIPDDAISNGTNEPSDVSPIWNPEFFGNMMVVNGRTWPYLEVEQRRYRFRYLNGSDSRFLILATDQAGMQFHQIGADGGFLAAVGLAGPAAHGAGGARRRDHGFQRPTSGAPRSPCSTSVPTSRSVAASPGSTSTPPTPAAPAR